MILLTGSTGFIGKHLVTFIQSNYPNLEIAALTNVTAENINCIPHDGHNYKSSNIPNWIINRVEVIVHLGAFTPKSHKEANNWRKCGGNITSTMSLLNLEFPLLKKIIYVSTIDVYAITNDIIDENFNTLPSSLYGWSKLYCENMVLSHCEEHRIKPMILRLGHVYGPGEELYQKVLPITMKAIIAQKSPVIYGDGSDLRSFIYVDDVVNAICNSIFLSPSWQIINVVHHESFSISEIIQKIINISKSKVTIEFRPRLSERRDLVFDNSRLRNELCTSLMGIEKGLNTEWAYLSQNG